MKRTILLMAVFVSMLWGCSQAVQESQPNAANQIMKKEADQPGAAGESPVSFQPFVIYSDKGARDNHFVPSGFMPDGKCLKFEDASEENCYEGKTCIKIVYDVACSREGQKWSGVYWLNPANNWGTRKGGFDLTGATKLTFWAKGEKGGEQIEEFKIGGIDGVYPDSATAVIGPVILGSEWKEYSIDLRGQDLSYISGGFSWATNVDVNPESCTFYLDHIQYE